MKFLLHILFLLPLSTKAQVDTAIYYQTVIPLPGMSKDSIYSRALVWAADAWTDNRWAIELRDKDAGIIKGNFSLTTFLPSFPKSRYLPAEFKGELRIEVKENRLRFSMTKITEGDVQVIDREKPAYDIMFMASKKVKLRWDEIRKQIPIEGDKFAKSLEEYVSRKEDW